MHISDALVMAKSAEWIAASALSGSVIILHKHSNVNNTVINFHTFFHYSQVQWE